MCGRYAQSVGIEGIEEIFDIRLPTHVPWEPSYNVAPTQKAPIQRPIRRLVGHKYVQIR